MKIFTADYIFPVSSPPIRNGFVSIDDHGKILEVSAKKPEAGDIASLKGVLVPGFINAHCHLELSYLKNQVPENTGLDEFIREVEKTRHRFSEKEILEAAEKAEQEMIENGIVAIGDISNGSGSFPVKAKKKLKYHTFIELLGFHPARAESAVAAGLSFSEELGRSGLDHSLSPHAPYSASEKMLSLIIDHGRKNKSIHSIHLAESRDEDEMFLNGTGKIIERIKSFGIDVGFWKHPGQTSLQWLIPQMTSAGKVLLVHNTFLSKKELDWLKDGLSKTKTEFYFCFCPSANLYIENALPDYNLFRYFDSMITVGTDSLASNSQLSILEELKIISERDPLISLETLIQWATLNGARFLGYENELGSIEKNKTPGLNLVEEVDLVSVKLKAESKVKKII